jgi:hypothetical protein
MPLQFLMFLIQLMRACVNVKVMTKKPLSTTPLPTGGTTYYKQLHFSNSCPSLHENENIIFKSNPLSNFLIIISVIGQNPIQLNIY